MKYCIISVIQIIPNQQNNPINKGLPELFISFTILVLNPIAPIAIIIKNLDISLNGLKNLMSIPNLTAIVVITLARIKNIINIGNEFFKDVSLLVNFLFACMQVLNL